MKFKQITIGCGVILYSTLANATTNPALSIVDNSTPKAVAITLQATNAKSLSNIKITGIDNMQVIGKQVSFNTSEDNYSSKLYLLPHKAGTYHIVVNAELNGKAVNASPITITVSDNQIQNMKSDMQKNIKLETQQVTQVQKQMNRQMQEQIQFFNNINTAIQKEQQLSSSSV